MIRADIFETVSLAVLKVRSSVGNFRAIFCQIFRVKMHSNYFQNRPPLWKNQIFASSFRRAGGLGDKFVGNFRNNLPLSILNAFVKKIFMKLRNK